MACISLKFKYQKQRVKESWMHQMVGAAADLCIIKASCHWSLSTLSSFHLNFQLNS